MRNNERRAFSGPPLSNYNSNDDNLSTNSSSRQYTRKSVRFNLPPTTINDDTNHNNEAYVEISTLDIHHDSLEVHSVHTAGGGEGVHGEDPELALLAKRTLEGGNKPQELKRFASLARRTSNRRLDRTKSAAAQALKGLKFIAAKTAGASSAAAWPATKKRFDDFTRNSGGLLQSSLFGEYIGMDKESKEFAGELFRALARKNNISGGSINKAQLQEFWNQISDESFDSRLQTFFGM